MQETLKKNADRIRTWNEGLGRGVNVRLIRTEGPQSRAIVEFVKDFSELAPRVLVEEVRGRDGDLPGLSWKTRPWTPSRHFVVREPFDNASRDTGSWVISSRRSPSSSFARDRAVGEKNQPRRRSARKFNRI